MWLTQNAMVIEQKHFLRQCIPGLFLKAMSKKKKVRKKENNEPSATAQSQVSLITWEVLIDTMLHLTVNTFDCILIFFL